MEQNKIPLGYKHTELGIIPQEWEVKSIGQIAKCFSGGTPNSKDAGLYGGSIPFIRSGEIHNDSTEMYLTEEGLNSSSAKMVDKGDLLFALYGANSGDCAISQINGAINQAILCIRSNSVINAFLQPYLELQKDKYIAKYLQGGQGNLSNKLVCSYTIPVPPMEEQRKIAEILGVWDKAIELQKQFIDKLELRKRALMQRLLTGRLRLPGFSAPWQKVKFKDIFYIKRFTTDTSKQYEVLSVTKEGIVAQKEYFNKSVASENISKYLVVEYGDMAMSGLNFWMGSCHILTNYQYGIISPAYKVYGLHRMFNISFIANFVRTKMFLDALIGSSIIGASIVRRNLDQEMLQEWTFTIPSLAEQTAIAEILSTADKEIELAKAKLVAYRTQKRGLMQQLLTGKKRVK